MSPWAQVFSEIYQVGSFSPFKSKILSPVSTTGNLFENYSPFLPLPFPRRGGTRGFLHNTATQRNNSAFRVTGRDGDLHQELGMNSRRWESALLLMRRLVSLGSSPAFGSARLCPVFPSSPPSLLDFVMNAKLTIQTAMLLWRGSRNVSGKTEHLFKSFQLFLFSENEHQGARPHLAALYNVAYTYFAWS